VEAPLASGNLTVLLIVAAMAGGALGWILAVTLGAQRREVAEAQALRERERVEADRALARVRRQLEELETRDRERVELFLALPDMVRQMVGATTRRGVTPLAVKLALQVFRCEQAALFLARPGQRKLALAEGAGLPQALAPGFEIDYGQGRIGYVAETGRAMDDSDFKSATSIVRLQIEAGAIRDLKLDVVAPIEGEDGLIGVLAVGGLSARGGHGKRLLKMVADLTGIAYTHVTKLRVTEHAADVDGLTGALNKRSFQKRLGDEIHKAEQEHTILSLLMLDIDHFKHYNDTNGHQEGDEVLKRLGMLLRLAVREDDVVARYGGEEFIVLYPGAGKPQALKLAESLRHVVESEAFRHATRQPLGHVTISGGIATFPEDSRNGVDLIRCADQALYEAKAAGRNRILVASQNYLT
jgi:diguanylate cyclase (GGDEF)-like protein